MRLREVELRPLLLQPQRARDADLSARQEQRHQLVPRDDEQRLQLLRRRDRGRLGCRMSLRPALHRVALVTCAAAIAAGAGAESAHNNYMIHCQGCHLPDGSGKPGAVPALSAYIGKFANLSEGRAFLVRVPGVAMSPLDSAETAAVLNWMLKRFAARDLTGDFEPFSADEVERFRRTPLLDVAKTREALIRSLAPGNPPG